MQWLRRGTLFISMGIGLAVLALVIHSFWASPQGDPTLVGQRVNDLQILVTILLALSTLYTLVFLLSPSMSASILRQQSDYTVKAVKTQLSACLGEFRELKDEMRRTLLDKERERERTQRFFDNNAIPYRESGREPRESPIEVSVARAVQDLPRLPAATGPVHLSSRLGDLNNEMIQIYQDLAELSLPHDRETAKTHLNRALGLIADPAAASGIHYTLACLLAGDGELGEALVELETAFMHNSRELGQKLAKDTEEGGPLYQLATQAPYDRVMDDFLMNVRVGA